jgi:hypothetical protein
MPRKQRGRKRVTRLKVSSNARRKSRKRTSIIPHKWTLRRFDSLSDEQRDIYFRAKRVIDDVRSGKSFSQALRDNKTTSPTVFRYFPEDFTKSKGARHWTVSSSDKHVNEGAIIGENGLEPFRVRGSKEISQLGTYLNDVKRALANEASALDKWRGKKIGGRELITDLDTLMDMAREGKLDFEDEIQWRS